jgi:hypothetical protein
MADLPGPATPDLRRLLEDVRDVMVAAFGISVAEATGRIRSTYGHVDLTDPGVEDRFLHRDTEYWANRVYYGPDAVWQARAGKKPIPQPWP